jgi:hypothetical protein
MIEWIKSLIYRVRGLKPVYTILPTAYRIGMVGSGCMRRKNGPPIYKYKVYVIQGNTLWIKPLK